MTKEAALDAIYLEWLRRPAAERTPEKLAMFAMEMAHDDRFKFRNKRGKDPYQAIHAFLLGKTGHRP